MNTIRTIAGLVLVAFATLGPSLPSRGQSAGNARLDSGGPASSRVRSLMGRAAQLRIDLQVASQLDEAATARYRAGVDTAAASIEAHAQMEKARAALAMCESDLADARRIAALAKPIDIDLKNATLKQAAEVLSRASGIVIATDPHLTDNTHRVTTRGRAVPLGTILEGVATAMSASIAPGEAGSIVLRPAPKLAVNGTQLGHPWWSIPWSDEWGADVASGSQEPAGTKWQKLLMAPAAEGIAADADVLLNSVSIAAVGTSQVVVALTGPGPAGQPGVWLTVYRVSNGKLTRLSSVFQASRRGPSSVPPRPNLPTNW